MHLFLLFKSNSIKKKAFNYVPIDLQSDYSPNPLNEKLLLHVILWRKIVPESTKQYLQRKKEKYSCVCTTATYSLARTSNPGQTLVKITVSSKEEKSVNIHEYKSIIFFTENILKGKLGIKYWILKNCKYRT